jgi:hypothetical protein
MKRKLLALLVLSAILLGRDYALSIVSREVAPLELWVRGDSRKWKTY